MKAVPKVEIQKNGECSLVFHDLESDRVVYKMRLTKNDRKVERAIAGKYRTTKKRHYKRVEFYFIKGFVFFETGKARKWARNLKEKMKRDAKKGRAKTRPYNEIWENY